MTVWFQASVAKELVETKLPTMLNNLQNMMNDDGYFINKQVSAIYMYCRLRFDVRPSSHNCAAKFVPQFPRHMQTLCII